MIDGDILDDEVADSTLRSIRWLLGGAAGGLLTHWVVNDVSNAAIVISGVVLFLVSVGLDLLVKAAAGTYGTNTTD